MVRKTLMVVAALTATGAASAQSSATIFGAVDLSYESVKTNAGRISAMAPSGWRSSKLGFRGVEDLGGGMSAGFWLEMGINPANGSGASSTSTNNQTSLPTSGGLIFSRRATVSISGPFGEVRLGRQYTPVYQNYWPWDPFYNGSVGASLTAIGMCQTSICARASNSIDYLLPSNLGGFNGEVMYAFNNRASTETFAGATPTYAIGQNIQDNGRHVGFRVGYSNGPLAAGLGYGRATYAPGTASLFPLGLGGIPFGNLTDMNLGGSYQFGPVRAMAMVARTNFADAGALGNEAKFKTWGVGADWGVGSGDVLVSYSRTNFSSALMATEPSSSKWAVGYIHNLSKRTNIYAIYARVSNSGGAAYTAADFSAGAPAAVAGPANVNGGSSGFQVGVSHGF